MSTVPLTLDSFEAAVARGGVVLVSFAEPGCGSCAAFAPVFEQASHAHPDLCFARVDIEAEPALAETFDILAVPTLMIFRDGVPLVREPGAMSPGELEAMITQIEALDMERINQAIAELVRQTKLAEAPRG